MKIKDEIKGLINYLVVLISKGYLGDIRFALNYAWFHPSLMPFIREIVTKRY